MCIPTSYISLQISLDLLKDSELDVVTRIAWLFGKV
jgi:hypothetical protein